MSRNQNTFAKRSREMEKKRTADEKRQRRVIKRQTKLVTDCVSHSPFSEAEQTVLEKFRIYMMAPRRMLCFSGPDRVVFGPALEQLVGRKILVAERFQGGYSLTESGFQMMHAINVT